MEFLKHYAVIALIFVVIDAIWLKFIANKMYKKELGDLLKPKPSMLPAVLFYLLYVAGIEVFALAPALETPQSLLRAVSLGAFLGLLMYATYDLTNLATLKKWPLKITAIDMVWGAFVTGLTTGLVFIIFKV